MRACAGWAMALACLGGAALAEERPPPLRLQQDLTITSRITFSGTAGVDPASMAGQAIANLPVMEVVQMQQAATGRIRSETSGLVELRDTRAPQAWLFSADGADRVVRHRQGDMAGLTVEQVSQDPEFEATRQAAREVAGMPCTDWRLALRDGPEEMVVLACFAADGLVLRTARPAGGMTQVQEVVRVARGPLDPALFAPPPGRPVVAE